MDFVKTVVLDVAHPEWNGVTAHCLLSLGRRVVAHVQCFPRGSVGSRRDIAAVSRSTGPLVSRIARRSSLEHAAISKMSADEKDASVFCQRDVGDGIFAGRSAFGARGGSGEGRTAPVTAVRSALGASRVSGGGRCASAAAGALDSREFVTCASSLNSSCGSSRACMSYLDAVLPAPARAPAAALFARSVAPSSSAVGLCMHAHGSLVHDACSNSWSDTVRKGPTGRKCTKGGVSGPAEDLRPVPEVVAGVNFRPAGGVRRQVVGSLPGRQPGSGTRTTKGSVVTPSLHPEVSDSLSVSPGPGKRIRELMGWTKVCGDRTIGDLGAKG